MTIYTLYVKTHLKTGLKYLGKTEKNPFVYKGSGKYWKRHIEKYGNDVWTNVVLQTEVKEEMIEYGLYFSNLWNIVESDEWANLKPEAGDGGFSGGEPWNKGKKGLYSEKYLNKLSLSHMGIVSPMKGKKYPKSFGEKVSLNKSCEWEITFPDGHIEIIKNLRQFCREYNLNSAHLVQVSKGTKSYYQHKGFKAKKIL